MDTTNMIAGIVTAAGTLGLFGLGIYGLSSWRNQLDWKESHDLAKRLLHSVYKVRDTVYVARNSFLSRGEADDPNSNKQAMAAYNKRWSRVTSAQLDLDAAMTEADVVWGKDTPIDKAEVELRQQIGKLYIAINHLLSNDGPNKGIFSQADEAIVYSTSDRTTSTLDTYDTELSVIISKYEAYLRQYLGHRK